MTSLRRLLSMVLVLALTGPASAATLVAEYQFENNVADSTANANNGTVRGAAISYVAGRFGSAAHFGGATAISVPSSASLNMPSSYTIALWFRNAVGVDPTPVSNAQLLGKNGAASNRSYGMFLSGADELDAFFQPTADLNARDITLPGVTFNDGLWHLFVTTYDAADGSQRLYADGVVRVTQTLATGLTLINSTPALVIGAFSGALDGASSFSSFYQGDLDDIRFYSGALTGAEITALTLPDPSSLGLALVGVAVALRRRR